jgi:hypothetical protein
MRGNVAIYELDKIGTESVSPLRIVTGGRDNEWFGYALAAELQDDALELVVDALGIARASDDSGRAYRLSIPLAELDGRADAIDVDTPAGNGFVRARLAGQPSGATGSGELLGQSVALAGMNWAVGAPRADDPAPNTGAVMLFSKDGGSTLDEGLHHAEFGRSLACWRHRDSSVLLIASPAPTPGALPRRPTPRDRVSALIREAIHDRPRSRNDYGQCSVPQLDGVPVTITTGSLHIGVLLSSGRDRLWAAARTASAPHGPTWEL